MDADRMLEPTGHGVWLRSRDSARWGDDAVRPVPGAAPGGRS